jgi:hypothetical protein
MDEPTRPQLHDGLAAAVVHALSPDPDLSL